jgi:hypothetical protein
MRGTPGIALVQQRRAQILRAEVVAPLADAVRLVDGEQAEHAAFGSSESSCARKRGVVTRSGAAYSSVELAAQQLAARRAWASSPAQAWS